MGAGAALRTRDLVAAVAALTAFFLATQTASDARLRLHWFVELHDSRGTTPLPKITDLDGDGFNELVMIGGTDTALPKLRICALPRSSAEVSFDDADEAEYQPPVPLTTLKEASLLGGLRMAAKRWPLALATGYLEPYQPTEPRAQVVAVVREDWTVLLYDDELNLLWERPVGHMSQLLGTEVSNFILRDVGVVITSQVAQEGHDGGLVVVSGRMQRSREAGAGASLERGAFPDQQQDLDPEPETLSDTATAFAEHFSFFALNGHTGELEWSHEGAAPTSAAAAAAVSGQGQRPVPQHQYKLDPEQVTRDLQGQDWTTYRSSVLAALPHSWEEPGDTKLVLAHFERQHAGGRAAAARHAHRRHRRAAGPDGPPPPATVGSDVAASAHHRTDAPAGPAHGHPSTRLPGLAKSTIAPRGAMRPHDEAEHLANPNVVLAHTEHGIEAVTLHSGRPVFSLPLPRGGLYADVNGDSLVDHLSVVERPGLHSGVSGDGDGEHAPLSTAHLVGAAAHAPTKGHAMLPPCSAVALSGVPPREQLFNGSLCDDHGSFFGLNDPRRLSRQRKMDHAEPVRAATPVMLHRPELFGRVVAQQALQDGSPVQHDTVFAVNRGIVSSYSSTGTLLWQVRNAPKWGDGANGYLLRLPQDQEVLVAGEDRLMLLSATGAVLAESPIPQTPRRRPILGDFDGDGAADVLVVSDGALWGFSLHYAPVGGGAFRFIVSILVLGMIAVWFLHVEVDDPHSKNRGRRTTVASAKLRRSTD